MTLAILLRTTCVGAICAFAQATPALAQSSTTETIVDTMRTLSGKQSTRPSGAKGQCFAARFTPTAEALELSKSPAFSGERAAVLRFSVGSGNAKVPDATKTVNRGLALRIDPNGPGQSEFVMVNAPVNFVKSPEQMLAFLQARLPGADGKPDAAKIKAFTDAFLAGRPVPASWVGVSYWAIHPYTLTNAKGATQIVKFKLSPKGGEVGLSDEDAKGKPADFLVDEVKARLAEKRPAGFDVLAILGSAADAALPATQTWPDEETRRSVKLAELTVTGLAENDICDREIFDPSRLAEERPTAYAISITQRH